MDCKTKQQEQEMLINGQNTKMLVLIYSMNIWKHK